MVSSRRRGVPNSAMRAQLIDAAEQIIRDEGYAALTARTLADKVALKRQIIHYYFESMDELLIAVVRHGAEKNLARLEDALAAPEPLRAVWQVCADPDQAALMLELSALANRRPAVRAEVARFAEHTRAVQTEALARHLAARGITPALPPVVAIVLLTSLSQMLALEQAIEIGAGHAETLALVDACLDAFAKGELSPLEHMAALGGEAESQ